MVWLEQVKVLLARSWLGNLKGRLELGLHHEGSREPLSFLNRAGTC